MTTKPEEEALGSEANIHEQPEDESVPDGSREGESLPEKDESSELQKAQEEAAEDRLEGGYQ